MHRLGWSSAAAALASNAEAFLGLRVASQLRVQEFERDTASEAGVACDIHDAHAATANALQQLVLRDGLSLERGAGGGWREAGDGRVQHATGFVRTQQRFDFSTEFRLSGAGVVEEWGALIGFQREHGEQQCTGALEQFLCADAGRDLWWWCGSRLRTGVLAGIHRLDAPRLVSLPSSRCSHARAIVQSRFTVAGDVDSASAVSSTLMPPKNRHTTT